MKQLWKEIKRSWRSFWLWIGFLFIDRWFDSAYLLAIIEHKCQTDADMYIAHGVGAEADKIALELYEVSELCYKLRNCEEEYYGDLYALHDAKWKEARIPSYYERMPASTAQEREEFLEIGKKVAPIVEADLKRLGELFTHVLEWSD